MGIFVITTSAFAYHKKKMEFDGKSFSKSAVVTSSSVALFSALGFLGLPILMELILVGVLTKMLRTKVLDNDELHALIKNEIKSMGQNIPKDKIKEVFDKLNSLKKAA